MAARQLLGKAARRSRSRRALMAVVVIVVAVVAKARSDMWMGSWAAFLSLVVAVVHTYRGKEEEPHDLVPFS